MPDHIRHDQPPGDAAPPGRADPDLREALHAHFGAVPQIEWDALEARVTAAASLRLAGRRSRPAWRRAAERWGRVAIPAGLAATLLLAAGLAFSPSDAAAADGLTMDEVVAVAAGDALPTDPLALAGPDAFLAAVLDPAE